MGASLAPHSSTLAWKIPWMEKPGRLQSMGSHRIGHGRATSSLHFLLWSTGFSGCGRQAPAPGFGSCGSQPWLPRGTWDLPGPGIKPVSPALGGGFLTPGPAGRPPDAFCLGTGCGRLVVQRPVASAVLLASVTLTLVIFSHLQILSLFLKMFEPGGSARVPSQCL